MLLLSVRCDSGLRDATEFKAVRLRTHWLGRTRRERGAAWLRTAGTPDTEVGIIPENRRWGPPRIPQSDPPFVIFFLRFPLKFSYLVRYLIVVITK